MALHSLEGVSGAGGVVPAYLPVQRADRRPIQPQQNDQQQPHRRPPAASPASASSTSRWSRWKSAPAAAGSARTTQVVPAPSWSSLSRITWRRRRLTRLRVTAGPTARLTTKPTRAGRSASGSVTSRWTTTVSRPARRPRRIARAKSALRRRRCEVCNTGSSILSGSGGAAATVPAGGSGGQPRAALAAAGGDDRTAGPGTHSQPEPVRLVPPTVVGLERTLAHRCAPRSG